MISLSAPRLHRRSAHVLASASSPPREAAGRRRSHTDARIVITGLGSTLELADGSGALQTHYSYEPFGGTSTSGSTSTNTMQFIGRENDSTGLDYYRTRFYSPKLQRFIAEDPIGFSGGSTDVYAYVSGNPLRYTDPLGLIGVAWGVNGLVDWGSGSPEAWRRRVRRQRSRWRQTWSSWNPVAAGKEGGTGGRKK